MSYLKRLFISLAFVFSFWSAIGYFATGAAAGIVAPANPALAMQLTAMGNITTDIVSGNMPRLDNPIEITSYIGGKILEGYTTAELGKGIANAFGYVDNISANLTSKGTLEGTIQTTKFSLDGVAKTGASFFQGAKYSPKVLDQMNKVDDIFHAFPKSVDGFATKYGQLSTKLGADGKAYQWLKMPGSYGGRTGVFEYTKDPNGLINHRFFNLNLYKAP